jgi:PAS domain S-box-containing protein
MLKSEENQIKIKDRVPGNLFLIFISLSLAIILLGIYYYFTQKDTIIAQQENELSTISDYKAKQIEAWLEQRINHANSILENKHRTEEIGMYLSDTTSLKHKKVVFDWFSLLKKLYNYRNITLYTGDGVKVFTISQIENYVNPFETEFLAKNQTLNKVEVSELYLTDSAAPISISIFIPLSLSRGGINEKAAFLSFEIDLQNFLFPVLLNLPTRHVTMESLIAQKKEGFILFLNELKFMQQTALKFKIPLTMREVIAVQASEGKEGITYGKDYRDKDVLACINRINGTSLFLITKIDMDEINSPVLGRTAVIFVNVLIGIILAGIIIGFIWRSQRAKHFKTLYEKEIENRLMEEHFAFLTKYANDIILLANGELRVVEVNDKALESYGYTKEEMLKLHVKDLRAPEHLESIKNAVDHLKRKGSIILETEHKRKDGSVFPVEISSRLIEVDGKIFYQNIIRDITERKKNEEIIKKNELLINSVIQNSPVGITIRDKAGILLKYNKAWMKIWGFDDSTVKELEEESRKLTFEERYSYFGNELKKIKSAFEFGESHFIPEIKVDNPYTGKDSWLSLYIYTLSSNGKTEQIVTLTRDITEQKHTEEKLIISEAKHRSIIEQSTILFYSHTPDNIITYISPQCRKFFDCEPEEAMVNWTSFATGNPVNEMGFYLSQRAIETGIVQPPYELELKSKTGRIVWVEVNEAPVVENGKTKAIVGSLTDITSRKKAEEHIFKLNRIYRVLSEINQTIVRIKDEKKLYDEVCKILVDIGAFRLVWAAEIDLKTCNIIPHSSAGHDNGYIDILVSKKNEILSEPSPVFNALKNDQILVYNNLEKDFPIPWRKESVKREYHSLCMLPLKRKDSEKKTVLCLYSSEYDFFTKEELELLTELAADVSFSLDSFNREKMRLEAETGLKESKEQIQMLYETSEKMDRTLNLEDTYSVIIEFVSKYMDCEGLVVSEFNKINEEIIYKAAWMQGIWTETSSIPAVKLANEGEGILSRVIRSGKSLIVNDYVAELEKSKIKFRVDKNGKTHPLESERKEETRSALFVPLKIEGKVIGVLHVISFRENAYTEEHKRLLESISVHISLAINNATLYRKAQEEINERKRTEEELRRSEERFSVSFKLSPIPILLTRLKDGLIIDANRQYSNLVGLPLNEIIGKKTSDLNIVYEEPGRQKLVSHLIKNRIVIDYEAKVPNKELGPRDTRSTLQVLKIQGEDFILSMIMDVTEKKKSEERLRKLSRAVNQSPASIIITDTKGNIEYVNSKFSEITGYSYQEVINQNPRILKSGETPADVYKELWKTITSGKEWHGEMRNKKKNGELFWEWASITPVLDSEGKITNFLAVKEDITTSKIIQEQIQLQATLLQNIHDAVIYVDTDFKIKSWNEGAKSIYGWNPHEVINKIVQDLIITEYYDTDFNAIVNSIRDTGGWRGEVVQYRKDKKKINILSSASSVKDEQNKVIGVIIVNKDITERKQQEDKIKTSLKEKEILLKEIHHRVKNNLQVISSLLKMQSAYIKDPAALESFKISSQRVKSMALIHEQLYRSADLSKIDFQYYVMKLATHLYQTYGISTDSVKMVVNIDNIMLSLDTAIPCGLLVNELISNSLKHAFPAKLIGKIEVEMTNEHDVYTLKVRDNGKGIPDSIDFKNTETLGLQLINTLTEQLEGKIDLKKDKGSEFIIKFKLHGYKERI